MTEQSAAYRVTVQVRNNLILEAIERMGHKSVASFCKAEGLSQSMLGELISLRVPPITKLGEFSSLAKKLMEIFGAAPCELWTDEQLVMALPMNKVNRKVDLEEIEALKNLERMVVPQLADNTANEDFQNRHSVTDEMLRSLTKREAAVLRMRFGLGTHHEQTMEEVGKSLDVTRERARQIEKKAIRTLRRTLGRQVETELEEGK